MATKPFISGRNVTVSVRQNNVPLLVHAKSISVEEVGSASVDEVNGELRGRPQWIPDYFKVRLSMFIEDLSMLDAHLIDTRNDDAGATPLIKTMGLGFALLNSVRVAYVASEGTRGGWKLDSSDRMGRAMQEIEYQFRYFKSAQAV